MNKLDAIKYLIDNDKSYDEWSEAGMYHIIVDIIEFDKDEFSKEELDELLKKAIEF